MKTIKGIWLHIVQLCALVFITTASFAQPKAGFTSSAVSGCPPMVVSFKDISAGNPTLWKWDLGNGTISYLKDPVTTYFNPGSYTVKLVVKNSEGEDSVIKNQLIVVNSLPTPSFGASDSTGCFPLKVRFSDSSVAGSGDIKSWQWDLGDGTLSNDRNPQHTYTNAGNFTVILKVTNSKGCTNVITKPSYVKLLNGVGPDFTYTSAGGCKSPTPVTFSNQTSGTGNLSYKWDFGDGGTSEQKDPVHSYSKEGVYTIKLIATNSYGCTDTLIKENAINIGFVKAGFVTPDPVCEGSNFAFTNKSTPESYVGGRWDFGDGTFSNELNPQKVYKSKGTYIVKLVTDFGSCLDSVSKAIVISPRPVAGFSASNNVGCAPPLNVSFQSTSADAVAYQWNFGDGTKSTLQNPQHTYTTAGEFNVTLVVINATGCTDTIVKAGFVKIVAPKILSISNLGIKGCLPTSISPKAVLSAGTIVSNYLWEFGDGTTSTDSTPTHVYTNAGAYNVKLTITTSPGCSDIYIYKDAVKAGNKPITQFSATPRDICAVTPVNFTDLTTNITVQDWFWTFGDGGTSAEQNPIHMYNDTGYFNVSLVVTNFGCSDTLKIDKYIYVRPPIARFDTAYLCSLPLDRRFVDKSLGANSWTWDFGDGESSTDRNPAHTYSAPGNYKVILKVSNGVCEHSTKRDVLVIKENAKLELNNAIGCRNARVLFNVTNVNAANISTYGWYFNGLNQPSTVTSNNPVAYSYSSSGERSTMVVLTNLLRCKDTLYASVPVKTYGPVAAFASPVHDTCLGNTINFYDTSKTDGIHPIVNYKWDLGEGTPLINSTANVTHGYTATGSYMVKFWVTDSYGCKDSIFKPAYVNITKPVASFVPSDTMLCSGTAVSFINQSQGLSVSYSWDFGDGTTSAEVSPVHTYTNPGVYRAKMTMSDKYGCGDSMAVVIKVFNAVADFALSDTFSTCPPLVVNVSNRSANFVNYSWDFGDGGNSQLLNPSHIYTYPGNYTLKLWVRNNGGCIDTLVKKIVIDGPTGTFRYTPKEICVPGKVGYGITAEKTVSYVWDYNDGNADFTTIEKAEHYYRVPGTYLPKVILENELGCKVAITGKDSIKVYGINTNILSENRLICDSGYAAFRDSTISNNPIKGYVWNFGDGTISNAVNPSHHYADTGRYTVTLITTTNFGCVDTARYENYVKVISSPKVQIFGDAEGCEPARLSFSAKLLSRDATGISWNWTFGNQGVSLLQVPDSQLYKNAGTYNVQVKATNADGCSTIVSKSAIIHPKPVIDAGVDRTICKFNSATLTVTGGNSYTWRADSTLKCTTCASPQVKPLTDNMYYVTGKTVYGCINEDSVLVKVKQPFKIKVGRGDTLCVGKSISLSATGADVYNWTPSLYLNNANIATPVSRPDSSITYRVIGKDDFSCFADTGTVTLKVYPIPTIDITNGDNLSLKVGSTVQLNTKKSSDVTAVAWTPARWLTCANCTEPIAAPQENITYDIAATNQGKCEAHDKVTINLICNNSNVYIPNTFTPNGDGVNDVFYPRGVGVYNIKSFKIFNRWGQVIFQKEGISANNPAVGWDGSFNGVALQADVYVYILEVVCQNNIVFPFKGNVTLIR